MENEPPPTPAGARRPGPRTARRAATSGTAGRARRVPVAASSTGLECSARRFAGEDGRLRRRGRRLLPGRRRPRRPGSLRRGARALDDVLPGSRRRWPSVTRRYRRPGGVPARAPRRRRPRPVQRAARPRARAGTGCPSRRRSTTRSSPTSRGAASTTTSGDYRSRVAINADLPHRLTQLPHLVAHESYPGHHTEHCRKERGLVERDRPRRAHRLPGQHARVPDGRGAGRPRRRSVSVGDGWGRGRRRSSATSGCASTATLAERVAAAAAGLSRVRQDAALMLHDRGAGPDEVVAYLQRWLLVTGRPGPADVAVPLPSAVARLHLDLRRGLPAAVVLAGCPAGRGAVADRFVRLLDEPLTPARVAADLRA